MILKPLLLWKTQLGGLIFERVLSSFLFNYGFTKYLITNFICNYVFQAILIMYIRIIYNVRLACCVNHQSPISLLAANIYDNYKVLQNEIIWLHYFIVNFEKKWQIRILLQKELHPRVINNEPAQPPTHFNNFEIFLA